MLSTLTAVFFVAHANEELFDTVSEDVGGVGFRRAGGAFGIHPREPQPQGFGVPAPREPSWPPSTPSWPPSTPSWPPSTPTWPTWPFGGRRLTEDSSSGIARRLDALTNKKDDDVSTNKEDDDVLTNKEDDVEDSEAGGRRRCETAWNCPGVGNYCHGGTCRRSSGQGSSCWQDGDCGGSQRCSGNICQGANPSTSRAPGAYPPSGAPNFNSWNPSSAPTGAPNFNIFNPFSWLTGRRLEADRTDEKAVEEMESEILSDVDLLKGIGLTQGGAADEKFQLGVQAGVLSGLRLFRFGNAGHAYAAKEKTFLEENGLTKDELFEDQLFDLGFGFGYGASSSRSS